MSELMIVMPLQLVSINDERKRGAVAK